jgi:asparagine synthase (glutamine-hydrolysing)
MLIDAVLSPLFAYDFPTAGQMNSSMGLLFDTLKHGATVALSGEGADEVFGGYPWFFHEPMLMADRFPWLSAFGPVDNDLEWLSPELVQTIQPGEHIRQEYCRDMLSVPRLAHEGARETRLREMFYMNLTRFLPFLLERKDRMSMAHGLEVRVPFCDHRLVEYMWNVPMAMKAVDGTEKGILRRAFEGLLPDDVRTRKKSAYPTAQDPAYHRATQAMALEIANDPSSPVQPLIAPEAVRALAQANGNAGQGVQLVSVFERIIQLNAWLERYHVELGL